MLIFLHSNCWRLIVWKRFFFLFIGELSRFDRFYVNDESCRGRAQYKHDKISNIWASFDARYSPMSSNIVSIIILFWRRNSELRIEYTQKTSKIKERRSLKRNYVVLNGREEKNSIKTLFLVQNKHWRASALDKLRNRVRNTDVRSKVREICKAGRLVFLKWKIEPLLSFGTSQSSVLSVGKRHRFNMELYVM